MNHHIIEIEESEDHEVKGITDRLDLLTINCSSESPPNPGPVIHSMSGSIRTDEQVARDQSLGYIQDQQETFLQSFEERKEEFSEKNNQENQEIKVNDGSGLTEMASLQQTDVQKEKPDFPQVEDLANAKVIFFLWITHLKSLVGGSKWTKKTGEREFSS